MDFLNAPDLGFSQPKSFEEAYAEYVLAKDNAGRALFAIANGGAEVSSQVSAGKRGPKQKLTELQIGGIRKDYAGSGSVVLAQKYGVSKNTILRVLGGVEKRGAGRPVVVKEVKGSRKELLEKMSIGQYQYLRRKFKK